jgi:hypothetical protein
MKILTFLALSAAASAGAASLSWSDLPKSVSTLHWANPECDRALAKDADFTPESYQVSAPIKGQLYLVPCQTYAYQASSQVFFVDEEKIVHPVSVVEYDGAGGFTATGLLTNAAFDPATNTLTDMSKGRGLGDCGQLSQSVLAGDGSFVLDELHYKACAPQEGDPSQPWPLVYKRKPRK